MPEFPYFGYSADPIYPDSSETGIIEKQKEQNENGSSAIIEIIDEEGNIIASSQDKMPEFPYEGYSSEPIYPDRKQFKITDKKEEKKDIINLDKNNSKRLLILLKEGPVNQQTVDMELHYRLPPDSINTKQITLNAVSPGRFEASIVLGPKNSSNTTIPVETNRFYTFSWFDATSDPKRNDIQDSKSYSDNQKKLTKEELGGVSNSYYPLSNITPYNFYLYPTANAFKSAGYETIVCSYEVNGKITKKALFHIKNQARDFYISSHGYKEGRIWIKGDEFIYPEDVANDWKDNLGRVIFACCSVLKIGDFNNIFFRAGIDHQRQNPGLKWLSLMSPERNFCLMGYHYLAPTTPIDKYIISKFFTIKSRINSYQDRYILKSAQEILKNEPPEAIIWVLANALTSDYDTACAITKNYYYFIRYQSEPAREWRGRKRWTHKKRFIYAIKRHIWDRSTTDIPLFEDINDTNIIQISKQLPNINSPFE